MMDSLLGQLLCRSLESQDYSQGRGTRVSIAHMGRRGEKGGWRSGET